MCGKGHLGVKFLRGSMCAEGIGCGRNWAIWVLQGTGVQECLEGFHRGCVDYLSRQFVPKWDSSNGESTLAMAGTTSLLVEIKARPRSSWRVG